MTTDHTHRRAPIPQRHRDHGGQESVRLHALGGVEVVVGPGLVRAHPAGRLGTCFSFKDNIKKTF